MYGTKPRRQAEQDTAELLNRLENSVISARLMPFSSSCVVDREEMIILIGMIRESLLQQANGCFLSKPAAYRRGQKEAENIMREAETRMASMIDEHEITVQARKPSGAGY